MSIGPPQHSSSIFCPWQMSWLLPSSYLCCLVHLVSSFSRSVLDVPSSFSPVGSILINHCVLNDSNVRLSPKVGQIDPKSDKSGTFFRSNFSTVFLGEPKYTEILSEKNHGFVIFWIHLAHILAKSNIPAQCGPQGCHNPAMSTLEHWGGETKLWRHVWATEGKSPTHNKQVTSGIYRFVNK